MKNLKSAMEWMVDQYLTETLNNILDTIWTNLNTRNVVDLYLYDGPKNHASLNGSHIRFIPKMDKYNRNKEQLICQIGSHSNNIMDTKELIQ